MYLGKGSTVNLFDPSISQLQSADNYIASTLPDHVKRLDGGVAGKLHLESKSYDECVKDNYMVVEALPEKLQLKLDIFKKLDALTDPSTILASNSSSYKSSELISDLQHKNRVLNTHFYIPPERNGVELMSSGHTRPEIIPELMIFMEDLGLRPFHVKKESMGFIFNRLWAAIKRESLAIVDEGVGDPEAVDFLFRNWVGAQIGPCQAMDDVGIDVVLDIEEHYAEVLSGLAPGPRDLCRRMISEGKLGRKSGEGFYSYKNGQAQN